MPLFGEILRCADGSHPQPARVPRPSI